MITFSKLGRKGHFGNQLFQMASVAGIAKANDMPFGFPSWPFADYFAYDFKPFSLVQSSKYIEKHYHFEPITLENGNHDLEGWFQSESYFDIALAKEMFTFKPEVIASVREKCKGILAHDPICISIRRGDFVDHPDYFQLPETFYVNALLTHFPDWRDRSLIVLSDDKTYCKFHFGFVEKAYFADGLSMIEQVVLASLCRDFIISNSTFSWWCAWLGEKENSTIVRPPHNFTAEKNAVDNDKDYFPARWKSFDHRNLKIELGDAILEVGEKYAGYYDVKFRSTTTEDPLKIKINDCIIPPLAVHEAVFAARAGKKNTSLLRKGPFVYISPILDKSVFFRQMDFGIFARIFRPSGKVHKDELLVCTSDGFLASQVIAHVNAGKWHSLKGWRYYYKVKKRALMFSFKKKFKILIGYDAKK